MVSVAVVVHGGDRGGTDGGGGGHEVSGGEGGLVVGGGRGSEGGHGGIGRGQAVVAVVAVLQNGVLAVNLEKRMSGQL